MLPGQDGSTTACTRGIVCSHATVCDGDVRKILHWQNHRWQVYYTPQPHRGLLRMLRACSEGCCWTNKCVSQCHDVNCDYDLCDNGILWYICSFNVLVFVCCVSLSSLCVSKSAYVCHVCLCVICTFYDNAATWQGCSHTAAILRLHWWWCSMIGLIVILFSQHGSVILWKTEYMRQDLKY